LRQKNSENTLRKSGRDFAVFMSEKKGHFAKCELLINVFKKRTFLAHFWQLLKNIFPVRKILRIGWENKFSQLKKN
jgi:hypothetical protein